MGLAASQARLLSITARLSDNEMHSQQIANAKINLAGKTQDASREYINSLNTQKLVYTMYDAKGNSTNVNLTPAVLYTYSPLKNQYGISNNAGQLLINSVDAQNYKNSANLQEFLSHYCDESTMTKNPQWESCQEQLDEYNTSKEAYEAQRANAVFVLNQLGVMCGESTAVDADYNVNLTIEQVNETIKNLKQDIKVQNNIITESTTALEEIQKPTYNESTSDDVYFYKTHVEPNKNKNYKIDETIINTKEPDITSIRSKYKTLLGLGGHDSIDQNISFGQYIDNNYSYYIGDNYDRVNLSDSAWQSGYYIKYTNGKTRDAYKYTNASGSRYYADTSQEIKKAYADAFDIKYLDWRQVLVNILGSDSSGLIGYSNSNCTYKTDYTQDTEPEILKLYRQSISQATKTQMISLLNKAINDPDIYLDENGNTVFNEERIREWVSSSDSTICNSDGSAVTDNNTSIHAGSTFMRPVSNYTEFLDIMDNVRSVSVNPSNLIQQEYEQALEDYNTTIARYFAMSMDSSLTFDTNLDYIYWSFIQEAHPTNDFYITYLGTSATDADKAKYETMLEEYKQYLKTLRDNHICRYQGTLSVINVQMNASDNGYDDQHYGNVNMNSELNKWLNSIYLNPNDSEVKALLQKTHVVNGQTENMFLNPYSVLYTNWHYIVNASLVDPSDNGGKKYYKSIEYLETFSKLYDMALSNYYKKIDELNKDIVDANNKIVQDNANIAALNKYDTLCKQLQEALNNLKSLEAFKASLEDTLGVLDEYIFDSRNTEVSWYTNLWHRINGESDERVALNEDGTYGRLWKILEDNLYKSQNWLQFALEQGIVTLEQVQSMTDVEDETGMVSTRWNSKIYSTCVDIKTVDDEVAIARAEAVYTRKLNEIEAEDKKYDNEIKKLDTEHTALKTEYESIKELISKNTDRSFKAFS